MLKSLIFIVLLLQGCVVQESIPSVNEVSTVPDKATIVFYRPNKFTYSTASYPIIINQEIIKKLKIGEFYIHLVESGKYSVYTNNTKFNQRTTFKFENDKLYFIKLHFRKWDNSVQFINVPSIRAITELNNIKEHTSTNIKIHNNF